MNLILITELTGSFVSGVIITAVISVLIRKKSKRISALETEASNGLAARTGIENFKKSKEFRLIKKSEYSKGFNEGVSSALNDFQIQYQKFENIDEKFFSSIVETGYFMQLTYKGFPVGDVTKRVIHAGKKVDKKRVDDIINKLNDAVTSLIQAAADRKISLKEVKHLISRK
ncbi:MAG TPA: hypothetical protein PKG60_07815 [Spirochaetota bacterium]|nr:hypothetical protein [Spirochaetota bacterium]